MRRALVRAAAVACAAAGLAGSPAAHAGLFDDQEARGRIDKLREDFDQLAKRTELAARNQIDFANQAELLKTEVAKLRGQIEVILNDVDTTQKRQKDFYVDLDSRLRKLESAAAQPAAAEAPAAADPAGETRDYEAALTAFKGAKYKEAFAAFQAFIKAYPGSTMLASAHYWAASSLYQTKDYARAGELFGALAASFPNDARASDALLAQANAQIEGGDAKAGRKTLEALIEKYPSSSTAAAAKSRLKSLPAPRKK